MNHFLKLLLTNTAQEVSMSCGQNQSDCSCGCSGSYDLFAPLQFRLNGLGSGLGDTDRSLFMPAGSVLTWQGEIDPGWWMKGSERDQDQELRRIGEIIRDQSSGFFSNVYTRALYTHRGGIPSPASASGYQYIIAASITVYIQTRVQVSYAVGFIESGIARAGASVVGGTVNVDVAQNPVQAANPDAPVSEVGPPAVDPRAWYDPDYDYPADWMPDLKLPSLGEFWEKLKFDPGSGISLATIALIAGGAFVAYRAFVR